jgi:hypothetical protein
MGLFPLAVGRGGDIRRFLEGLLRRNTEAVPGG